MIKFKKKNKFGKLVFPEMLVRFEKWRETILKRKLTLNKKF